MNLILESTRLVPNIHLLEVEAPEAAAAMKPGQFVIVRADEDGERIPLTAAGWDAQRGSITLIFMIVGRTTHTLAGMKTGGSIASLAGPLGNELEIQPVRQALLVGGCYGIGTIYPLAQAYKAQGARVTAVVEGRSAHLFYLTARLETLCDRVVYITRDGTRGLTGHIAKNLPSVIESLGSVDVMVVNGCNYAMKRASDASRPYHIPTQVCLNTIMIDGTGMCGVCRVTVDGKMKFACVDGPYFDGHQVNWDELAQRRKMYLREELVSVRSSAAEA